MKEVLKELQRLNEILLRLHRENPKPAQKEGLWPHHVGKNGLFQHSLEVYEFLYRALKMMENKPYPDEIMRNVFFAQALGHDISKLFGDISTHHAENSWKEMKKIILKNHIKLPQEIEDLILVPIRYHRINFSNPELFTKRGRGNEKLEKYFLFVLLLMSADLMSIGKDFVENWKV